MVRAIIAVLLLNAVAIVAPLVYLNIRLVRSGAYRDSLKTAFSSAQVQSALGDGMRVRQPVVGFLIPFADSQFAEWSVVLTGSRGTGQLYGVATEVNGVWEFSRLAFESTNGEDKVELTPVRQLRLPSVPAKNVYLVPIGLAPGESVQWATDYYKSKLGIYVKLLSPIALDPKLIDPARHQLNPDKCVALLAEKYPEIARDPFSILVGVTSTDMYFPGFNWSYAENVRIEGRMIQATDSEGHVDAYSYDEKGEMLTAAHGTEKPFLTNAYFSDSSIKEQILGDGRKCEYAYFRTERNIMRENQITTPNGLETHIQYVPGGYTQSLPAPVPQ